MLYKRCGECRRIKRLTCFYPSPYGKAGFKYVCRMCDYQSERRCSKCGEVKPISEFFRQKLGKCGRYSSCKDCYRVKYRIRKRRTYLLKKDMTTKVCSRCHQEKDKSEFYPCKNKNDGLNSYCKVCLKIYVVTTRRENRPLARITYENSESENVLAGQNRPA